MLHAKYISRGPHGFRLIELGLNDMSRSLTTRQPLWVILCRLPQKRRKEIEEIVEEMKEGKGRKTGMKVKNQMK